MPLSSEQLIERFNTKQPPTGILFGMTVLEVDQVAGRVKMSFDAGAQLCNPRGTIQGGMVAAMLDDAAAFAGIVALGEPGFIASMELKTSFFAPAYPGKLYAEGRCLKMGKSSCFLEADLTDADGKLLARLTSAAIPIRSDQKPKLVDAGKNDRALA
jgi:uncharacterized protein (TIGR00369 family)